MFSNLKIIVVTILLSTIATVITYGVTDMQVRPAFVHAQLNTQQGNTTSEIDYTKFHSNIEEIKGHIEKAEMNKNIGNDTLALEHTLHPIEEVLSLVTIPLSNTDSALNETYSIGLHKLSELATNKSSTLEEFDKQSQKLVDLSNKVISTVIPSAILNNANHNITVIQGLLSTSEGEYGEGVKDGKVAMILEYQDGSAFMEKAFDLFNSSQPIIVERDNVAELFNNLSATVQQLGNASSVEGIIDRIIDDLSASSTNASDELVSSQQYVSNIRSILDQIVSVYSSGDTAKAKELATTAYLENFEHLEKPIGKDLADQGEEILRVKLREQIDNKSSVDEIKQTISNASQLLDKVETVLK